ncbi:potassium transporter TrkA [Nocardiopsis gilva YIM 90087]|uniref:Potassium transporter TrkA n=1 Tax=Nocardiopsis gilva YIM 90087 TaxID=1235441 RepID=A0A223S7D3_9ACTN|nr:cation:proton antiporter regulatory subunit [Nocardiopsis gilva]ASU84035.1 potassium transporter TrkA [Nocardiopsis gilva YIM 90087]
MDVTEVLLPGVGVRYEFTTAEGNRIGIIVSRRGDVELVSYAADPDVGQPVFRLTTEEADTVAEILGAPRITERFADLSKEIPGLRAEDLPVAVGSPFVGRRLGDTRARTRTGASIVAIVRGDDVIASPGPDEVLHSGDNLVVIGTQEGIAGVNAILKG